MVPIDTVMGWNHMRDSLPANENGFTSADDRPRLSLWFCGGWVGETVSVCLMLWYADYYGTALDPFHIWFNILPLATVILILLNRKRIAPLYRHKQLMIVSALLSSVGILGMGLAGMGVFPDTLFVISMCITGLISPIFMLAWWEFFACLGPQAACFGFVGSLLINRVFSEIFSSLENQLFLLAVILFATTPLVSLLFLFKAQKNVCAIGHESSQPLTTIRPLVIILTLSFMIRVILTVVLTISSPSNNYYLSFQAQLLATGLAALILFVMTLFSKRFSLRNIYFPVLLFVAFGFSLLPVLESASRGVAIGIAWVGFMYLEVFVITVIARFVNLTTTSPLLLMGLCNGALYAGSFVGRTICSLMPPNTLLSDFQLKLSSIVIVMAVILVSVFVLTESRVSTLWGLIKPLSSQQDVQQWIETRCVKLAKKSHLTPRESEILYMLALGKNATRIHEELVLSILTVRTHIHQIYEKLGVGSQQELITLILGELPPKRGGARPPPPPPHHLLFRNENQSKNSTKAGKCRYNLLRIGKCVGDDIGS
jgi:DNA-binding CsgD family transcriptional regulator